MIFPVVKTLHELGHGFVARRFGAEVHDMGIMFLVFTPIPYVDASSASALPEKTRRALVGAAGMIVEVFVAALAFYVWPSNLVRSFRPDIGLEIDIQYVSFGLLTAIPCGLIINELISNCLKYAFPDEPGEISVSLRPQGEKHLLTVRDNGVGFPGDLDIHDEESQSLGMFIVTSQTEQLDGEIQLTRSPGTTFEITFVEQSEGRAWPRES